MLRFASIFALATLFTFSPAADAAVRARLTQASVDVKAAEVYAITGRTTRTTADAIFTEIGKRVRQAYYRDSYEVDAYSPVSITPDAAVRELLSAKGEWEGLSANDEANLRAWIRTHQVTEAQIVGLTTNYMAGTGMEDLYYFLSETEDVVLVIRAFWYAV